VRECLDAFLDDCVKNPDVSAREADILLAQEQPLQVDRLRRRCPPCKHGASLSSEISAISSRAAEATLTDAPQP